MRFRFIDAERAGLAMLIFRLCRLLQVSVSVSVRKVIESYEPDVIQCWPWQIEDEADVDSRKPRLL